MGEADGWRYIHTASRENPAPRVLREPSRAIDSLFCRDDCVSMWIVREIPWRFQSDRVRHDALGGFPSLEEEGSARTEEICRQGCVILPPRKKREVCRPSERSFGLILLHVAVCSVGRKLTSSCLPARNKIRFSLSLSLFSSAICFSKCGQSTLLEQRFAGNPFERSYRFRKDRRRKQNNKRVFLLRFLNSRSIRYFDSRFILERVKSPAYL